MFFFAVGSFVVILLTVQFNNFKRSDQKSARKYQVKYSSKNLLICQEARKYIKKQEYENALIRLIELNNSEINEEVDSLKMTLTGIKNQNKSPIIHPNFNRQILNLIRDIEKNFDEKLKEIGSIRNILRKRYQKRLNQKLGNRHPINIKKVKSKKGSNREESEAFVSIPTSEIGSQIINIFNNSYGRLLITGEAGAGKTCLLLQLALQIMEEEKYATPIIIDLANWDPKYGHVESWVVDFLIHRLGIRKKLAYEVVSSFNSVLLFDGFDETSRRFVFIQDPNDFEQYALLQRLNNFSSNPQNRFVITTRIQEYLESNYTPPVNFQIEIQPLKKEQIIDELEKIRDREPGAGHMIAALKRSKKFQKVIENPFYLNVTQSLFSHGMRGSNLDVKSNSVEKIKEILLDSYINNQLKEKTNNNHNLANRKKWLSYIAHKMFSRIDRINFELTDLQYELDFSFSKTDRILGGTLQGIIAYIPFAAAIVLLSLYFDNWHIMRFIFFIGLFSFFLWRS